MIDYNVLETKKNGQLTTSSVKEFIYRAGGDNCWYAFKELSEDPEYQMSYETYYKGLCVAYGNADRIDVGDAALMFSEFENEDWLNYADKKTKKFYDELPNVVTLYRGCTKDEVDSGIYGISWTTDKKVAEFFAKEYIRRDTRNGVVMEIHISKSDICAVLLDRDESEVILPYVEDICQEVKVEA